MRLINKSQWPDEKIKQMIEFASEPLGIKVMKVVCRTSMKGSYDGWSSHAEKEIEIEIRRDSKDSRKYPHINNYSRKAIWRNETEPRADGNYYKVRIGWKKTGYLRYLVLSKEEHILHVIAHELRHQWHKKRCSRSMWCYGTNSGKRTKMGDETDCDAYGINTVRRWRKLHAVDIYQQQPDMCLS